MASIGMRVVTGMATVLRRDCGGGVGGGSPENIVGAGMNGTSGEY